MILIAEMQNGGVFEAPSKKRLTSQMIEHFGENNQNAEQIKAIYCIFKNDRVNEFCGEVVNKIQEIIDNGVAEWRKIINEEYCGRKEIENEVRRMT